MTVNLGVNYLAILVAAIAAVAIGIVYYGILGVGDRQSRMLRVSLVNAGVIAVLSLSLGAASIGDVILLGAVVWLGFGATFKAAQVAFERRPWAVWVLQGVHD